MALTSKGSMGRSFGPLTFTSRRILTSGNETMIRSDLRIREVCHVSSWATGKIWPNRTVIKQKHIPNIGLNCRGLARWVRERRRTCGQEVGVVSW